MSANEFLGPGENKRKNPTLDEILAGVGDSVSDGSDDVADTHDKERSDSTQQYELNEWRKAEWQKILDTGPQFGELRKKAAEVRENVHAQAASEGYMYKGHVLAEPDLKGNIVLREGSDKISEDVLRHVMGSGLRNRQFLRNDYELDILLNILGSGVCDSEWAPLQGAMYVGPFFLTTTRISMGLAAIVPVILD